MGIPADGALGAAYRSWIDLWARGSRDAREDLFDEIADKEQTGFPWEPAVEALSKLDSRTLWKTFDDDDLGELYDWAHEAGLPSAADSFKAAALARPYIDDGKVPKEIFQLVMERDGWHCQELGCGSTDQLTIDHKIVPYSEGGSSTDPDNLQVLCQSCNSRKGARAWTPPQL